MPTDRPSAWWFDEPSLLRLIFAHIAVTRQDHGKDMPLREFVRQFHGLSSTAKAKAVCDQFPGIERLSDLESQEERVTVLLKALRAEAAPPSAKTLGCVGEEHFKKRFQDWYGGVQRFWYRKASMEHAGAPFFFEVALAETRWRGGLFHGVNFSPTFEDPLASTRLATEEFAAFGVEGFLERAHANPDGILSSVKIAAAVHLICPAPEFLDRGKTRLKVPQPVAEAIARALWLASKALYEEEERRKKNAAKQARADANRERAGQGEHECSLKDAVFRVLPDAFAEASGVERYPVSARTLYYKVRPRCQAHTSKTLNFDYFSQNLVVVYQREHGPLDGLYYEPRGNLYEPHTGKAIPLGTREVADYQFPPWLYDKILYVEKKGLWPILQAARLAERYDMAIVAGEGYACEACRALFAYAEKGQDYQLFVIHDADPHGYNIARTLREETQRMPGHHVEVIDLGLKLEEALAMGLETETFTRRRALPKELVLNETERAYFEGEQSFKSWIAQRVELNAMSSPQLVRYIEEKLQAAGVRGKVIPDGDVLTVYAASAYEAAIDSEARLILEEFLPFENFKDALRNLKLRRGGLSLSDARSWIEEAFAADATLSWNVVLKSRMGRQVAGERDKLKKVLRRRLLQMTKDFAEQTE